ncbi:major facilitator superfamily domain-containing protein [Circinella umbellata]|nr:major facilitator superfamily domain-containing protein [Circinella umbellata]
MLFGILALFATTLLFLFATHFWMLALARILQGISDACVYTLSLTLVSDTFPSEVIGTQLGRVMLFQSIGIAAGTPIGGVLFDKLGYRGPFIFSIILAVIDFFLRLFLIERRNNPKHWFVHNDSDMITNDRFRDERIVNYSTIPEFALDCKHSKKKNNSIVKEEWGVDRYNNDEGEEGVVISKKQVFTNKSSDQEPDATTNNNNCSLESSSLSPNQTVVDHNRDLVIITDVCENGIDEKKKKKSNNMSTIQLLCNSRILVALLFSLLPFLAISMLEPTLPIRLAHEWDYNSSQIGLVFLAQILPSFLAVPLSGYLYDRYGAKLLCFITMFISAIVIGFLGVPSRYQSNNNYTTTVLGEGIIPLVVLITLFGFFINMIYTPAYAEVSTAWSSCFFVPSTGTDDDEVENKEKDGSGKSYGFISAVVCLGNFLGPVLGGYLFETIGFFWLSITVGCILLLFSPFSLVFLTSKTIY